MIVLGTKLAGDLSVKLGQPSVLGKLIVGIVIGPAVLGWIEPSEFIDTFSQIGVLLLMFIAGLETDVQELNRNRNASLAVAVGGVILPFVGGYLSGIAIGMEQAYAIFLGLILSATSVSITVQTLKDLGQLNTRESTTILGAAVADDVLVVVLLAFVMSFLVGGDVSISSVVLKKILFFVTIVLIGWKLVPPLLRLLAPLKVTESVISAAFIVCMSFAYYAELLGITGIIGAFAAGIAISQTKYKEEVEQKIEPIAYAVFVPVFFVSIGLSVSFKGIGEQIWFIFALTLIAIFTKLIGCGLGARVTGFNMRSSFAIGAGMISRGEVALIIAALGLEAQLLAPEYFTSLVVVVILTTLVTPPILKKVFAKDEDNVKQEAK
ncbi:cation:proton antiporter [Brevibacillus marinus]|uniref:cation:proton antiporter n=1 Tax=Brevibacillus marinus TaxID=2496837 RepID=UPI000F83DE74|nr:cation:proton antiporter [Brevibacillus marinus]